MITAIECLPCMVRQAINTVQRFAIAPSAQVQVVQEVLHLLGDVDLRQSPPLVGQRMHRLIRESLGDDDPYRQIKADSNKLAMTWYPQLQTMIDAADDPLAVAIRVATAGNIIDYGAKRTVDRSAIASALDRALAMPLDAETLATFREAVALAETILYLADNAGEIVFDRLLIECLPTDKVTLVVRGAPVINDATRIDAAAVGLDALVRVIDNGSDVPGTAIEDCTADFQALFAAADVVIAKGQGNYETLADAEGPVYHLFIAKCPMVAQLVGRPMDTPLFHRGAIHQTISITQE